MLGDPGVDICLQYSDEACKESYRHGYEDVVDQGPEVFLQKSFIQDLAGDDGGEECEKG